MRRLPLLALAAALACGPATPQAADPGPSVDLLTHVDPFIGTGGLGFGVGSAYPGPAVPFAMIHPGPDTRAPTGAAGFAHCAGYHYDDPLLAGFSLLRMHGTGVPDYGNLAFMPVDGMTQAKTSVAGYAAPFDHADEVAEPGYYRVTLDGGLAVELTSTLRGALFRVTFPEGADPVLLLDAMHALGTGTVDAAEVALDPAAGTGRARIHALGDLSKRFGGFELFAAFAVDTAPAEVGTWDAEGLHPGTPSASGTPSGAWWRFAPGTRTVRLRVAVSFVDADGAARNLAAEVPDFDFDAVRTAARAAWAEDLGRVEIWGVSDEEATVLATAAYHTLLMPTLMSDVDGRYLRADGEVGTTRGRRYSDFSLWDTYRTLHPWLLLTDDPRNADLADSLLGFAREAGALPRWSLAHGDIHSMIGDPAAIVLAESAAKGVVFDRGPAYEYALRTAYDPAPGSVGGRGALESYLQHGYVAADEAGGSVSKTLEYASADLALADWSRRRGELGQAELLEERGDRAWRAVFDLAVRFPRGRYADGTYAPDFDPLVTSDAYTEGNAWQYRWLVPDDPDGLAEVLGGREAARSALRTFFESSAEETPLLGARMWYWHGNEPDLLAPWLFAEWGRPEESLRWIDWIDDTMYGTGPDGLAGNDDGGTLSAWRLLAAAGLYPVPGTARWIVTAPRVPRMVLHRATGDLVLEGDPEPRAHLHRVRVLLDGDALDGPELDHGRLVRGGHVLRFEME